MLETKALTPEVLTSEVVCMRQVFQQSYLSKTLCVEQVPAPTLLGQGVLVQNAASLISPGTERAVVSFARKSLIAKARSQSERVSQLLRKMQQVGMMETYHLAKRKLDAPIPLGYSSAGVILQVSPDLNSQYRIGQRVACAGSQYANHADVVAIPKNLTVALPDNVSFEEGSFVAPGAIALQGVRLANIALGETVLVIGLGLIGQLTCQLVKAQGGIAIGVDLDSRRLKMAKDHGCDFVFNRNDVNLYNQIHQITNFKGVDHVLITAATPSSDPVNLASELARDRAQVVVVGDVGMNIPRNAYFKKELSVIVSRSYGPGRYDPKYEEQGQSYPEGYVRWSEQDNMAAFIQLIANKKINVLDLIDQKVEIANAASIYDTLADPTVKTQPLGIVIQYPVTPSVPQHTMQLRPFSAVEQTASTPLNGQIGLGLIGAGQFAKSTLLPALKQQKNLLFQGLSSQTGLQAKLLAQQNQFAYCTTDTQAVLDDSNVHALMIATRHDSHARLLCEALQKDKHVFVEKPLATNPDELAEVIRKLAQYPTQKVMVGYNRRYAPMTQTLLKLINQHQTKTPLSIIYRVNAGLLPPEHWQHQAGGRIIGEVCHFVDWCMAITNSLPIEVSTQVIGDDPHHRDWFFNLRLANGSVAQIQYLTRSQSQGSKEHIEIFSPLLSAKIEDFKTMEYWHGSEHQTLKFKKPEKGFQQELDVFFNAITSGNLLPVSIEQALWVTQTTFDMISSYEQQKPIQITPPVLP